MYTVTARLHGMIYVVFHAKRINMAVSLNGTKHMYIIMASLDMMFYKAACLDVHICLCSPKLWNACM
jgi:hypothetical protein